MNDFLVLESRRGKRGGLLAALILLVGLGGALALGVYFATRPMFPDAAEVTMEEFLLVKSAGRVREVWLQDSDLYAELLPGLARDGKTYRHVHTIVPPAYLLDAKGFSLLKDGVDATRFTLIRRRNLGCR